MKRELLQKTIAKKLPGHLRDFAAEKEREQKGKLTVVKKESPLFMQPVYRARKHEFF